MEITFINVGYGDAILVQSGGYTLLLDGGSAQDSEFNGCPHRIRAADYLMQMRIPAIDLLVISHIHEDHVCGLEEVLRRIPVREIRIPYPPALFAGERVFAPGSDAPRSAHLFSAALSSLTRILRYADAQGIPVSPVRAGETLRLPDGLTLETLAPNKTGRQAFEALLQAAFTADDPTDTLVELDRTSNDNSLLLKLHGEGVSVLLAADNCPRNWTDVPFSMLENVNVLKLPHHGQIDSISEQLLENMPLTHVVTTASSDRRYNSACPAVYQTLRRLHPAAQFLFTDERSYPPYFSNPAGAHAVKLVIDSGQISLEFIRIQTTQKMEA